MEKIIKEQLSESIRLKEEIIEKLTPTIEEIASTIIECYRNGRKVVLFGNGGSAADAQHIAAEMVGKFAMERASLPAIALNTNTSIITAIANDYDFSRIFERQVESLVDKGDIAIGISTSGKSPNVINGLSKAKEKGAKTIAFTGQTGGKLNGTVDIILKIPSTNTPRIQEAHITIAHIVCGLVESKLYGEGK